jgi:RHS repeat-associated protein
LGSVRVVTDAAGTVTARRDYVAFGGDLTFGAGDPRSGVEGDGDGSGVRQKFTGKERDGETGWDYFLARYYSPAQGRFTSPDEFPGGIVDPFTGQHVGQPGPLPYADITDPQTLNKYAYVRNNPLRYTDPDGHCTDVLTCGIALGEAAAALGGYVTAAAGGAVGGLIVYLASPAVGGSGGPSPNPGHYFAESVDKSIAQGSPTRGQALGDAKKDAGVPTSQQPEKQASVPATDQSGKLVVVKGKPQTTREYNHTTGSGEKVVIQDHPGGHSFPDGGKVGPHINVRPQSDTRHGSVPGTKPHYPYKKPGQV